MNQPIGNVRVRFAPSPTGYLHVGGARTAIFNWLCARHTGGVFVLRIEDTDVERSTRESEAGLMEDLRWLGLDWDEGPDVGGPHTPYRQSERLELYRVIAKDLVARGLAYPCFCREEELEQKRQEALKVGLPPKYDGTCRALTEEQIEAKRAEGLPEAIRFRVPPDMVVFDDVVRGAMDLHTSMVGDFVLLRANGLPTYNYAAAVDDHHMGITHVIRGEEHLSNTLRQMLIYRALGAVPPVFAHAPLILAEDRSKLSKRHGASSVGELRESGFVARAVMNYLVLLGWSHPEGIEVMTPSELIDAFTLERINASAAVFDRHKLVWMNGQTMRAMAPESFYDAATPFLPAWLAKEYKEDERRAIVALLQDAIETLADLEDRCAVFAVPVEVDAEARAVLSDKGARTVIAAFAKALEAHAGPLTPEAFKALTKVAGAETKRKGKDLFFPLRAAITGCLHGPDLSRVAAAKGRARVLRALVFQSN